jgi:hypothetical protein
MISSMGNAAILPQRPEAEAKAAFLNALKATGEIRNSIVISELAVARHANRADIVLAKNHLRCFEIKTKTDKLNRLERQIHSYSQCFDNITVVCASNHVESILRLSPLHVGVVEMGEFLNIENFITIRTATQSPEKTIRGMLDLIPARQIRSMLRGKSLPTKRSDLIVLAEALPFAKVQRSVLKFLKKRYAASSRAFFSGSRTGITADDIRLLSAWSASASPLYFDKKNIGELSHAYEKEFYYYIGQSFGSVPKEIAEMFPNNLSLSISHRQEAQNQHRSVLADVNED